MRRELYMKKENRDARAKVLRKQGFKVSRGSYRNQQMHPEYIRDWEGEVHTGFGNTQYRTWFTAVYEVSWE